MKSSTERLLANCPWKEFKAENGKTYYHNNDTKESVWLIPKELQEIKVSFIRHLYLLIKYLLSRHYVTELLIMPTAILAEAYCSTRVPKNLSSSEICFLGFLWLKILHRTQIR